MSQTSIVTTASYDLREIERDYWMELTAKNTQNLVNLQSQTLQSQVEAAQYNLRAMGELARLQAQGNSSLADIEGQLDELNETARVILQSIKNQTEEMRQGFQILAGHLVRQQEKLEEIAFRLRTPYQQQAREVIEKVQVAIIAGMEAHERQDMRERELHWDYALRAITQHVLPNPVGERDYVAWFQLGYLHWKFKGDIPSAQEAFYRSCVLSADDSEGTVYHLKALRHLAHMQYLQGKYEDAVQTIAKALKPHLGLGDHDTLFDGARYAAKTGRENDSMRLLERCIVLRPETMVTMYAEGDFNA